MTIEITRHVFICPYCEKEYETYDQAEDCALDCADIEYPDMDGKDVWEYKCSLCGKVYDDEFDAEECEREDMEDNPELAEKMESIRSRERLKLAAEHPGQRHLFGVSA